MEQLEFIVESGLPRQRGCDYLYHYISRRYYVYISRE